DLHELGHGNGDQKRFMQMYGWHVKHFASLVGQLKQELGPDGKPLLDSTVLVFVNEGGLGPGDGKPVSSHSTDNMMALVAGGRGLGLRPGRHIRGNNAHPAQVLLTSMNSAGVGAAALGDVSGRLAELGG